MLWRDKSTVAGRARGETPEVDERERFVLRGGLDDVADSASAEPEGAIDVEEALRQLGDPERSRTRARRQSAL